MAERVSLLDAYLAFYSTSSVESFLRASYRNQRFLTTKWFVPVESRWPEMEAHVWWRGSGFDCFYCHSFKVLSAIIQEYVVLLLFL
jgi:hypothetical protein